MAFQVKIPSIICIFAILLATTHHTVAYRRHIQQFKNGRQSFDNRLFTALAQKYPDKNIIFSPFSIQTSLAIVRMGAEGQTAADIDQALALAPQNAETLANNYHAILEKLEKSNFVTMANKVYVMTGYTVKETFNRLLTEKFYSKVDSINFADGAKAANTINTWVEKKTNDLIKDLVKPDLLDATTRLVLVNAIHFKGEWVNRFSKDATELKDFYLDETNKVAVEMMYVEKSFKYAELDYLDAKVLEMPYKDSDLSMLVILPNKRSGLVQLVNKLTYTSLDQIVQDLDYAMVEVDFPKCKATFEDELSETLSKLGLKRMFSGNAELGQMLESDEGLQVSAVIHKAFIDVNEVGTEAAAATAAHVHVKSAPFFEDPSKIFKADHPFYYIIKNANNLPLFKGVYKNNF